MISRSDGIANTLFEGSGSWGSKPCVGIAQPGDGRRTVVEDTMGYNELSREQRIAVANHVEGIIVYAQKHRECPIEAEFLAVVGGIRPLISRVQQVECCFGDQEYSYSVVTGPNGAKLTAKPKG